VTAENAAAEQSIAAIYKISLTLSRLNALFLRNLKMIRLRQEQRRKGLGLDGKPGDSRGTGGGRRETSAASRGEAAPSASTGTGNDKGNRDAALVSAAGAAGASATGGAAPALATPGAEPAVKPPTTSAAILADWLGDPERVRRGDPPAGLDDPEYRRWLYFKQRPESERDRRRRVEGRLAELSKIPESQRRYHQDEWEVLARQAAAWGHQAPPLASQRR
jgi:hypothetical protein